MAAGRRLGLIAQAARCGEASLASPAFLTDRVLLAGDGPGILFQSQAAALAGRLG